MGVVVMRNPLASPSSTNLGLLFARVPLGAFFVMAGFSAFRGKGGVTGSVEGFSAYALPGWFGHLYVGVLPYVAILVGAMLVLGILGRLGGLVASLMLASFLVAFHVVLDSHALAPMPHRNAVLLGVALLTFLAGPGRFSLDQAIWKKTSAGGVDTGK
jgi:putative oxidoreductase